MIKKILYEEFSNKLVNIDHKNCFFFLLTTFNKTTQLENFFANINLHKLKRMFSFLRFASNLLCEKKVRSIDTISRYVPCFCLKFPAKRDQLRD